MVCNWLISEQRIGFVACYNWESAQGIRIPKEKNFNWKISEKLAF